MDWLNSIDWNIVITLAVLAVWVLRELSNIRWSQSFRESKEAELDAKGERLAAKDERLATKDERIKSLEGHIQSLERLYRA